MRWNVVSVLTGNPLKQLDTDRPAVDLTAAEARRVCDQHDEFWNAEVARMVPAE